MIFTDTSLKAEVNWEKIVKAMSEKRIPSWCASVSLSDGSGKHCICVFNTDFTDRDNVDELDRALRSIGVYGQMVYKPDIYTYIDVYKTNEWGIRPTIYKSDYDLRSGRSIISDRDPVFNNSY